jgi:hypothetical protein
VVQLHVKVGDIIKEIANFNSSQLVPIAIGTYKSQAIGTLEYARRIPSLKIENYTWGCGEIALCSAKVAIFGTLVGTNLKILDEPQQLRTANGTVILTVLPWISTLRPPTSRFGNHCQATKLDFALTSLNVRNIGPSRLASSRER